MNLFRYAAVIPLLFQLIQEAEAIFGGGKGPLKKERVLSLFSTLVSTIATLGIVPSAQVREIMKLAPKWIDTIVETLNVLAGGVPAIEPVTPVDAPPAAEDIYEIVRRAPVPSDDEIRGMGYTAGDQVATMRPGGGNTWRMFRPDAVVTNPWRLFRVLE